MAEDGLRHWMEYRGHRIPLKESGLLLGRSADCQLVLDDALVSRRHARLSASEGTALLEDLGSANGTFVNGRRVTGRVVLSVGDRVLIGQQELVLHVGKWKSEAPGSRFNAKTLSGIEAMAQLGAAGDATDQREALTLLGPVADKVLALGRGEEAERLLAQAMESVVDRARKKADSITPELAEKAAGYAVRLAETTRKSRWVDYCVELYRLRTAPFPTPVVDKLYTVVRGIQGVQRDAFEGYVEELQQASERFGPAERFLVKRTEGLMRLLG